MAIKRKQDQTSPRLTVCLGSAWYADDIGLTMPRSAVDCYFKHFVYIDVKYLIQPS